MPTGSLDLITESREQWPGMTRYWSLTLTLDDAGNQPRFTADTRLAIEREE